MTVRMKEVASRAGVSVKTVSNVVNGYLHVAPSTRERVQQAIDEMGYRPNLSARSLRSGRTGIIAVAVPRLDEPYFAELAAAIIGIAAVVCAVFMRNTPPATPHGGPPADEPEAVSAPEESAAELR